jgi:ssRNA-specific RNase YbeY (16S rRNA maturation enzyme)
MSVAHWKRLIKRAHVASLQHPQHVVTTHKSKSPSFQFLKEWISGVYLPTDLASEALQLPYIDHYQYHFHKTFVELFVLRNSGAIDASEFMRTINVSIAFLEQVSARHSGHIKLLWVPLNAPKTTHGHCVPDAPCVLGPSQVNSGYTIGSLPMYTEHHCSDDCGQIVVYRSEEAYKVCIHEIIHLWGYDDELLDSEAHRELTVYLTSAFAVQSLRVPLTPREAVTDAIAIMLYSSLHGVDKWHGELVANRKHLLNQAAKVLQLQHIKHWNELQRDNKHGVGFGEHTHVFSYYVLKAAMYYDLETLLQVLQKRNPTLTKDYCIVAIMRGHFHRAVNALLKKPITDKSMRMSAEPRVM